MTVVLLIISGIVGGLVLWLIRRPDRDGISPAKPTA